MKLWLARHARPLVEEGICYGALDVGADPHETLQAATRLAATLPAGVQLVASPLVRCRQLVQALVQLRPDLVPRFDARLAEIDFGAWEGRRWDEVPAHEMQSWTDDFASWRPGGTGESAAQFMGRVREVLAASRASGVDQAWISHGGVFKALSMLHSGTILDAASSWPAQGLPWGECQLFDIG